METPSIADLEARLSALGWKLDKLDAPKPTTGRYVAKGSGPGGQKVDRDGQTPEMALGALLAFAQRANSIRTFAKLASLFKASGAWNVPFAHQLEQIGQRYAELPVYDPKAVPAWNALAEESRRQADAIRNQLKVNITDDPEPYPHHAAMIHDIHHNGNFVVSRAHSDHPIWTPDQNVNFRIVHDVMGHGGSGGDFGWNGELAACSHHFPLISPLARQALMTECIGQTAYALRKGSHGFGPQKMATMPEFLDQAEKNNGSMPWVPHGEDWRVPERPQQVMPVEGVGNAAWGWVQDPVTGEWRQDPSAGDTVERTSAVNVPVSGEESPQDPETGQPLWDDAAPYFQGKDPNQDWQVPAEVAQNALEPATAGSPGDYLDREGQEATEGAMEVPWWERNPDGTWKYPVDEQKRIIMNAFRVCMLSPLKELKWNAAHYQGIYDMPATAKPHEMWERLDNERRRHNVANGHDPEGHLSYFKDIRALADWIGVQTGLSRAEALDEAKRRVFQKVVEVEQKIGDQLGGEGDQAQLRIELEAHKIVGRWLRSLIKGQRFNELETADPTQWEEMPPVPGQSSPEQLTLARKAGYDDEQLRVRIGEGGPVIYEGPRAGVNDALNAYMQQHGLTTLENLWTEAVDPMAWAKDLGWHTSAEQLALDPDLAPGMKGEKYAGFMGSHLEAIAQVVPHLDAIRAAALKDIYTDNGRGFIFRNAVMNMNIKGVNPKVVSFIWLMLYPRGSDLGIVDTHIARGFRRPYEEIGNVKDYYKLERMQKTLRDMSGYGDMPLGQFHHGMWDLVRASDWQNGWDHSDHSPLRLDEPEPWDQHDWGDDTATAKTHGWYDWQGPEQLEYARPYAEQVGQMYDQEFAGMPKNRPPRLVPVQAGIPRIPGSPHGGPAGTDDYVCPDCGSRVIGDVCRTCGRHRDGSEQPVIAGPADTDWHESPEGELHNRAWVQGAQKRSDYQGWTNWETWNTQLMIDNERPVHEAVWRMAEQAVAAGQTQPTQDELADFQTYILQTIIGPYNKQQIADAQEWNDTPMEDRKDHDFEELIRPHPGLAESMENAGWGPNVDDYTPNTIDPALVNWDEIWQHWINDVMEEQRYERGEPPSWEQPQPDLDAPGTMTLPEGWA